MATSLTLVDLVRNGTLSDAMAATLWAAVDAHLSFVVAAVPRFAGKSTTMNAMLGLLPREVPVHHLTGDEDEMAGLKRGNSSGYLVAAEVSPAPVSGYLWGPPVWQLFDTLEAGYALATALHASGVEEAFEVLCQGNGLTDEQAGRISLVVYIHCWGRTLDTLQRRVAAVHEVDGVKAGKPRARLLHRWIRQSDRFEAVEPARFLAAPEGELERRRGRLAELVASGRTSPQAVAAMVRSYHDLQR